MFRQIFCQQLKTLRFRNVLGAQRTAVIPQFINSRTCHTIIGGDSVNSSIDRLRIQVENKSKISDNLIKNVSKGLEGSKVDSHQSLHILRYCANGKFYNDPSPIVNEIWHQLKRQNAPKIQHYIAMMQFHQECQNSVELQAIFGEMIAAKIKPNALAYSILLESYCRVGNVQKATDIWEEMISKNFHNHDSVYHGLIICHVLSGQIDIAKLISMEMKKMNYKANFYVLESFLKHYTKENDIENIKKTFDSFAENEVPLNAHNVIKVMYQLSKNGKLEHIDNLMEYLKPLDDKTNALRTILLKLIEDADAPLIHTFLSKISENLKGDAAFVIERMVQSKVRHKFFDDVINNLKSFDITIETHFDIMKPAINGPSIELIWKMLHFMKSQSFSINESHFAQLLSLSTKKGSHHLSQTVKTMCSEFGVQPQTTTIRDVIMPGLVNGSNDIRKILKQLQAVDLRYGRCMKALLSAQLMKKQLAAALLIASDRGNVQFFFGIDLIVRPLLQTISTKDINPLVRLMKIVHKSFENYNTHVTNDVNHKADNAAGDLQSNFISEVLETAGRHHRNGEQRIEPLLREFENEGFSLTGEQAKKLRDSLGKVTTQIDLLLKRLSSGKLEAKPIQLHSRFSRDSTWIQNRIAQMTKNGKGATRLNRPLYNAYLMEGNLSEAKSLVEKRKFELLPNDHTQLIKTFVRKNQLSDALGALKNAQHLYKSFKLQSPTIIAKLVLLMIDAEHSFDEIEAILIANRNEKPVKDSSIFDECFHRLASNGNVELLNKLHEAAVANCHIKATPSTTRFLVDVHLKKNDITEAADAYKRIGQNHQTLSMSVALMTAIIKKKEFEMLEDVYSMHKKINGNHLAASNLALAYIKCGYTRQAEFIFNDNQISNLSNVLVKFCEHFQKNEQVKELQTLMKATENALCDRNPIYEALLNIYCEKNDIANAIRLCQEFNADANIRQSKSLESKLNVLMKKNDVHLTMESLKSGFDLEMFVKNKKAMN